MSSPKICQCDRKTENLTDHPYRNRKNENPNHKSANVTEKIYIRREKIARNHRKKMKILTENQKM